MLNIDSIQNGIVIDHIQAGKGMRIYELLELEARLLRGTHQKCPQQQAGQKRYHQD